MNYDNRTRKLYEDIRDKYSHSEFPQHMRRCFMTGKQCIFSTMLSDNDEFQVNTATPARVSPVTGSESSKSFTIFVIMAFKPNLNTFYEWSLKPFLFKTLGLKNMSDIFRADEHRKAGYIICEKICHKIQTSDLVVVDISVKNLNVLYELGIAVGLNKTILFICDKNSSTLSDYNFLNAIGIKSDWIQPYTNVGYLTVDNQAFLQKFVKIELKDIKGYVEGNKDNLLKIVSLVVPDDYFCKTKKCKATDKDEKIQTKPDRQGEDIKVTINNVITGAVGVAIKNIYEKNSSPAVGNIQSDSSQRNQLEGPCGPAEKPGYVQNINDELSSILTNDQRNELEKCETIQLLSTDSLLPLDYEKVVTHVNSSFIIIIDLAGENPYSYYWLGYCHARGLNAIPLYRNSCDNCVFKPEQKADNILAFDIRALWYINYDQENPKFLSNELESVFYEIITKDIAKQQRKIFWDKFNQSPRIQIFTGAVHNGDLSREMVGDWDLRTVSELVRYLSSSEVAIIPELQRPIYAYETIREKMILERSKEKMKKNSKMTKDKAEREAHDEWINKQLDVNYKEKYKRLLRLELAGKNSIIIASADVNPLTEIVLEEVYKEIIRDENKKIDSFPDKNKNEDDYDAQTVIAIKGRFKGKEAEKERSASKTEENDKKDKTIIRYFSTSLEKVASNHYGFLIDGIPRTRPYKSQDDIQHAETPPNDPGMLPATLNTTAPGPEAEITALRLPEPEL